MCLASENYEVPGLLCGIACVILHLAILVQYQCVTDRRTVGQTRNNGYYCTNIASCGKTVNVDEFFNLDFWLLLAAELLFVDLVRQRMRDAGFVQLLTDLRNHHDTTINAMAAAISLRDDAT